MTYDPRGFKAVCITCGIPFFIPWETMCDAGICDECLKDDDFDDDSEEDIEWEE